MKTIILLVVCILISNCYFRPKEKRLESHKFIFMDATIINKNGDSLLRFICIRPDCYKIDSFILRKD